jgi:hypothetical protein
MSRPKFRYAKPVAYSAAIYRKRLKAELVRVFDQLKFENFKFLKHVQGEIRVARNNGWTPEELALWIGGLWELQGYSSATEMYDTISEIHFNFCPYGVSPANESEATHQYWSEP